MAGYSKIYLLGGAGGFQGADGINSIHCMILVGDADRQWLEPRYLTGGLKPLGKLEAVIPEGPNHPDALLDACIAFCPDAFAQCPSMKVVAGLLGTADKLDLCQGSKQIAAAWARLRGEAKEPFRRLNIWKADLERLSL